ncbi:LCP family protein [Clostridium celatum]|uniref:Cell envelope-like function transcriptional attenuator common domain protein n=1 Tax=Clostridium celatum DSM 1785 TaxID=545697 RepID=L1QFC4_9CLOT|nr:LCP family protein [Clostridium celatum]EKY26282.1 cell envelope-like function transcriptional attenuator common domain protein [Clostridium celatum DSM 1785]MCE9653991.1 LCP family protein [Clostridium celatum]
MSEQRRKRSNRNKKKWSNKKKAIVSTLCVFIFIIGILVSGYLYIRSKIYNPSTSISNGEYTEVEGITNVLLVGIDARDLDENCRADSIIVATLDNNNKKIKLTSLFRDTLVDIPGYGEAKLNAAYALGGPELLMETIRDTYDINLDKYVVINFWGFEAVIDQIGGLELNVEDYVIEELNKYIGESTGGNDCPVTEPGLQVLNGKQALSYARIRYNVGDEYGRTERQREVLFKLAEKLKETKPSKYLGIMNKMIDYIKTNIEPLQALNMAYTIYKFPTLETEQLYIPVTELAEGRLYKDLGWVFLIDKEQNAKVLKDFIYEDKIPNPDEYDYEHLNQVLADYAAQEGYYNNINNINPEDYIDAEDKLPEKQPETSIDNSEDNSNDNSSTDGSVTPSNPNGGTVETPETPSTPSTPSTPNTDGSNQGETTTPPTTGGGGSDQNQGGTTTPPTTGGDQTNPDGSTGTNPDGSGIEETPDGGVTPPTEEVAPPVSGESIE